jgi:DNA-binding XRE family transcriptional regulator
MSESNALEYQVLTLNGVRYAVLRERALRAVCRHAGVEATVSPAGPGEESAGSDAAAMDPVVLAGRIAERRRAVGLTQAELARRAGVRIETLNRIERGRTTPDFSTIRKLVEAINQAEAAIPG